MRGRLAIAAVTLLAALLPAAARPDSDEAWLRRAARPAAGRPLLVLLVDTSAAMAETLDVPPPYDPARDYPGPAAGPACREDRIYWRRGPGPAPDCASSRWISRDAVAAERGWRCETGRDALGRIGVFVAGRAAQWEARPGGGFWRELRAGDDGAVECRTDRGRHGAASGPWYAGDGGDTPWRADAEFEPDWDAPPLSDAYEFFSGNFLNYLATPGREAMARAVWLRRLVTDAAASTAGLDLALARLSHDGLGGDDDGRGGMVALAPASLPDGAAAVADALGSWTAAGPAPLAEALAEVARWLAGAAVHYGLDSHASPGVPLPSAAAVRRPEADDQYLSPYSEACRPVTLAIPTAGSATADAGAAAAAGAVPVLAAAASACADDCLAALSGALSRGDLLSAMPGLQAAQVTFVAPVPPPAAIAAAAAQAGSRVLDLADPLALVRAMAQALQHDAGRGASGRISAAGTESGAAAAGPRAVYYALSLPRPQPPWRGNLRRYVLRPTPAGAAIVGRDGEPVFDAATGRLLASAWSLWAAAPEGAAPTAGGAAARLPPPSSRRIFADLTTAALDDPANLLDAANPRLTAATLGLDGASGITVGDVVAWVRGADAFDADVDGDRGEPRAGLGDPGMRAPRVLRYAADGAGLAFTATNDGLLHAFDADSGVERWAFVPAALLPRLADLAREHWTAARTHGFDGALTLAWRDAGADGRIEAAGGDEAWLVAALGRGGTGYYALDVTRPDAPVVLWSLGAAQLPAFAESWPEPVLARMRLDDSLQGGDTRVVVLAGGHDPAEDARAAPVASAGAGFAIVAARTGRILWRAGGSGMPGADLAVPGMQRSLPAAPRLVDTDGDGLDDRAYLVDAGGRLWRFDFSGQNDGAATATVSLVADVGGADDARREPRFEATPDLVYLRDATGRGRLAIAFGSGWLSRPAGTTVEDAFYVVFDALDGPAPATPAGRGDLIDVTDGTHAVPADARGWRLRLVAHGPGEKTAGSSVTLDHRLHFTTYQPLPPAAAAPCGPPAGISRLYALDVRDGRPAATVAGEPAPPEQLDAGGLPPPLRAFLPAAPGGDCAPGACVARPFLLLGGFSTGLDFGNDPVRTSWRQLDATAP